MESRHRTGSTLPTPHTISVCILLQLAILGRHHHTKKKKNTSSTSSSSSSSKYSDSEDEEDEELDDRRRDCVSSIKATGIGPLLVPAARRDLLLHLLDQVTSVKTKKQAATSVGPGSVPSTRETLLSTCIYYEPTLPQLIETLNPGSSSSSSNSNSNSNSSSSNSNNNK